MSARVKLLPVVCQRVDVDGAPGDGGKPTTEAQPSPDAFQTKPWPPLPDRLISGEPQLPASPPVEQYAFAVPDQALPFQ